MHLAVAYSAGKGAPSIAFVKRSFSRLGQGSCGRMEDPAEDVFVNLVSTPRGNYRVYEGIWEGAGYHLQRILNIVEAMPVGAEYVRLHKAIESLLRLSDAVAERAGVREYDLGEEFPRQALPSSLVGDLASTRDLVRFKAAELEQFGISTDALSEFAFSPVQRDILLRR